MKTNIAFALALCFGFVASASADNTFVVTQGATKAGKQSLALDFQSSGDASAFQFLIKLPRDARNIDTSKCLAALPKTHTGVCQAAPKGGKVAVVVYSGSNTPLPAGIHELGTLSYSSSLMDKPALDKMVVSSASGQNSLPVAQEVATLNESRQSHGQSLK